MSIVPFFFLFILSIYFSRSIFYSIPFFSFLFLLSIAVILSYPVFPNRSLILPLCLVFSLALSSFSSFPDPQAPRPAQPRCCWSAPGRATVCNVPHLRWAAASLPWRVDHRCPSPTSCRLALPELGEA